MYIKYLGRETTLDSVISGWGLTLTVFNQRTFLHFNMSYPGYSSIFTHIICLMINRTS